MNREYYFKWRRKGSLYWHKQLVNGHDYKRDQEKMILYFSDGGLREICKWLDCECKLGIDWVIANKEQIKEEAGQ